MVFYFREERARLERQKIAEQTKGMGRPKVGGPFELVDHNGNKFTSEDLKGKYALVCLRSILDMGKHEQGSDERDRSTLASRTVPIYALMSWIRWRI